MTAQLPTSDDQLLVVTAFGDEDAWQALLADITTPNDDGFQAYVTVVDDPAFDGSSAEELAQQAPEGHAVVFVVDGVRCGAAFDPSFPPW